MRRSNHGPRHNSDFLNTLEFNRGNETDIHNSARQFICAFGRRAEHRIECFSLRTLKDAPGQWKRIEVFDNRDLALPHGEDILLRNPEFAEQVLIKRVVNVALDPIQTDHALFELLGKFPVDHYGAW